MIQDWRLRDSGLRYCFGSILDGGFVEQSPAGWCCAVCRENRKRQAGPFDKLEEALQIAERYYEELS